MDKQSLRERVWDTLADNEVARFPFPPHGRIPNFEGAERAAERLAGTNAWTAADAIKSNPDAPQRPVRRLALEAGKTVYMAVPRLRDEACFHRLDPSVIDDIQHATTIKGSREVGEQIGPTDMPPIDLIVSGSVVVDAQGTRVGKGEGYTDLEFAILSEFDLVDGSTPTTTTCHDLQVVDGDIPATPLDVPLDVICTPTRTIKPASPARKPTGVDWTALPEGRTTEIPILQRLEQR